MKIRLTRRCAGSALLLTLFTTGLMGFALASYLILVQAQNHSIMRSTAWNSCIAMSEAGIEEAMTHLNRSGITNLLSAGWTTAADGTYTRTRYFGRSYYRVDISAADPPVIISEGYVPVPYNGIRALGWLAVAGVADSQTQQMTRRKVRVTTRRDSAWNNAMVAKGTIDLNGNNIGTDSFDPEDPNASTNGRYDYIKRRDKGHIATNLTITNSILVGNANIMGRASTGPGGTIAVGPNGAVGSRAWHESNYKGIEPGWSADDMNVYFPDVTRPFESGFSIQSGTLGTTTFKYLLDGGGMGTDFVTIDLTIGSSEVMLVTNRVRLLVTGNIDVHGSIEIAPNSSFQLYMEGASTFIGGSGVVNNAGYASRFYYFGLPTNIKITFAGNADYIGAIYAPSADFYFNGSGKTDYDFMGASVTSTVTMNGHFKFHYDESLGRIGWTRGYLINSWNEI